MDILWDRAVYKELNVGDGLFFPINSNANIAGKHYISATGSSKRFSVYFASYSMAYKNEEGDVILEYVLPIATSDTEKFTGYLLVSD